MVHTQRILPFDVYKGVFHLNVSLPAYSAKKTQNLNQWTVDGETFISDTKNEENTEESGITRDGKGVRMAEMEVTVREDVTETDTAGEIVFSLMHLRKQRMWKHFGAVTGADSDLMS